MDITMRLSGFLLEGHPREAASALNRHTNETIVGVIEGLRPQTAANLLSNMSLATAFDCLRALQSDYAGDVIDKMTTEIAARILQPADSETEEMLLRKVRSSHARAIRMRMRFREDTIGALMETPATLKASSTVDDAKARVQHTPHPYVYVVDEQEHILGVVSVASLGREASGKKLGSFMTTAVVCLNHQTPVDAASRHPAWAHYDMLPVVDARNTFVGVLRHKALRQRLDADAKRTGVDEAISMFLDLGKLYWTAGSSLFLGPVRANRTYRAPVRGG